MSEDWRWMAHTIFVAVFFQQPKTSDATPIETWNEKEEKQ